VAWSTATSLFFKNPQSPKSKQISNLKYLVLHTFITIPFTNRYITNIYTTWPTCFSKLQQEHQSVSQSCICTVMAHSRRGKRGGIYKDSKFHEPETTQKSAVPYESIFLKYRLVTQTHFCIVQLLFFISTSPLKIIFNTGLSN
jgi:hypothetical protein